MFWLFALAILILGFVYRRFRRALVWVAAGLTTTYLAVAVVAHVGESQQAAARESSAEAARVAWFKAHPEGCAPFEKIGERGTAVLESDGNCGWNLPIKD